MQAKGATEDKLYQRCSNKHLISGRVLCGQIRCSELTRFPNSGLICHWTRHSFFPNFVKGRFVTFLGSFEHFQGRYKCPVKTDHSQGTQVSSPKLIPGDSTSIRELKERMMNGERAGKLDWHI